MFHCLDESTMMTARAALLDRDAVRVPFFCQRSGLPKELLLISRHAAERMVVATKGMVDVDEARVLALLHITPLCDHDLPELLRLPLNKVRQMLSDLARRGLAVSEIVEDASYFSQASGEVHLQFTDLALGAQHA